VASGDSTAKSRKGFLLFGLGDGGGAEEMGNAASIGVPETETFLARNGFVFEFDDSTFGSVNAGGMGFGSSKGDTTAISDTCELVMVQTR
jgi:hypothetical protein